MSNKARQIIEIDFWQREMPPLELQQSESSGRRLEFQIHNYGEIFDITGYTAKFQAVRPDGQPYEGPCEIVTPAEGRFDYVVTADAVSVNGQMRGQIVFTNADGTSVRSRVILINVLESLDPDQKIIDTTAFAEARKNLMKAAEIKAEWDAMVEEERAILEGIRDEYANVTETVQTHKAESQAARDAAQAAQAEAEESARLASVSEGNARVSETAAAQSATEAAQSESNAADSASSAARSKTEATDKALEAARTKQEVEAIKEQIVTDEAARQQAESERKETERLRVAAETARQEAHDSQSARADQDHTRADQDHTQIQTMIENIEAMEAGQLISTVSELETNKADKTWVNERLDLILEGAPEALNSFQELADALGNDPNFATTIMTELALKVSEEDFETYQGAVTIALDNKVEKVTGMGLSTHDFTAAYKDKLEAIEAGATKTVINNTLTSTSTTQALSAAQGKKLQDTKVDKVEGKSLSTNDFTDAYKSKVDGVEAGANKTTVINALNSDSATSALSAAQGKALDGKITSAKAELQQAIDAKPNTPVVDNLTSDSTTSALSAKQGKALKTLIDNKPGTPVTDTPVDDSTMAISAKWALGVTQVQVAANATEAQNGAHGVLWLVETNV